MRAIVSAQSVGYEERGSATNSARRDRAAARAMCEAIETMPVAMTSAK